MTVAVAICGDVGPLAEPKHDLPREHIRLQVRAQSLTTFIRLEGCLHETEKLSIEEHIVTASDGTEWEQASR